MHVASIRLDLALFERGLARSRSDAREKILRGAVTVEGRVVRKPSTAVDPAAVIDAPPRPYVSRGGEKLAHALDRFAVPVAGREAIDVGASTGGFTDVLLQRGAASVVALDVGHGQLDPRLAEDPRVTSLEGRNARAIGAADVPGGYDLAVVDVSFISLTLVLPPLLALARPRADLVALIKPQFEVGPARVGKGGIVRDDAHREAAVETVREAIEACGFAVACVIPSPILGGGGNAEFLVAAHR